MSTRAFLHPLAALLLVGATLVGCGGGDAEAPPPPVGRPPAGPDVGLERIGVDGSGDRSRVPEPLG